jgi:hypothetical protein
MLAILNNNSSDEGGVKINFFFITISFRAQAYLTINVPSEVTYFIGAL